MSAADNDTTALLAAIRRDSFMAQSGQSDNWTPARLLGVADDCTLRYVAPALKKTKQGWFREETVITMAASVSRYDTPQEGMWNAIENMFLVNASDGSFYGNVDVVDESNRQLYSWSTPGTPTVAWFENSQLVLSPAPSAAIVTAYSLTASYYRRPSQLVLVSDTVRVTAVNSVTQTLTLSGTRPAAFVADAYTSGTPYRIDIINRNLPNTRILANQLVSAPSTTAFTFSPTITAANFAKITVGSVVASAGTSPYPDLPPEGVPFLRDMVVRSVLTSQTDVQALQVYLGQQAEALGNFLRGMGNRADGSPRKLSLANAGAARFIRNYGARYRG